MNASVPLSDQGTRPHSSCPGRVGGLAEYLAQDQVIDPAVYGVPVADVAARVPYSDAAIFQQVGLEVHETSSEVEEANHVQLSWGQAVTPNEKQPLVEARPNLLHGNTTPEEFV